MRARILTTISFALLSAGCQGTYSQDAPVAAQPANLVCAGFGLRTGTATYDECVAYQESRAQAYSSPSVPPYRMDQYNNLVDAQGYRVDSMGRRMSVQSPYTTPTTPTYPSIGPASSGREVLRDEYGNRYDARGNRI